MQVECTGMMAVKGRGEAGEVGSVDRLQRSAGSQREGKLGWEREEVLTVLLTGVRGAGGWPAFPGLD